MSEIINAVVPIDAIVPHPRNYKRHPDTQIAQLKASHARFRQYRSVVIWRRPDGTYLQVAGHGIVQAMRERGVTAVRADILPEDTPQSDIDGILAADNLLPNLSVDDDALLAVLLQEQRDLGADLASLGTDEETLREMLSALGDAYAGSDDELVDDDDPPEPDGEQTRVQEGDVWQLGKHIVACINSCDPEQVVSLITDKRITFVFADPPYGVNIVATNGFVGGGEAYDIPFGGVKKMRGDVGGGASHIRKTGMSYLEASQKRLTGSDGASKPFGSKAVRGSDGAANVVEVGKYFPVIGDESTATAITAYRLCADLFPKATQVWWGANYYANALPPSSCWIVWDKENTGNFADVELAWCSENKAARLFRHMWNGMLKDSEQGIRRIHPTQKPIALADFVFSEFGQDRDVIFDPFLGSGITVIAAERLGRAVIGCELSPAYINATIDRWEHETGQTATLLSRKETAHANSTA